MSFTRDLLNGLKPLIVATGMPTGSVVFGDLPSSPSRAVALTAYGTIDEAKVAKSTIRVQVMCRGAADQSRDCDDIADEIFLALHGLEDRTFGDAHLIQCFRISSVPLGIDVDKRSTRADNYEIDVDLPLTAGRPF